MNLKRKKMHKELIEEFKKQRKRQKISQEKVSEKCTISLSSVTKIETDGRAPMLSTFMRMCNAIGYMVTIAPIPKHIKPVVVVKEKIIEVEKEVTNYDDFE